MAVSTEQQLDEAVIRAVELAQKAAGGRLRRLTVDYSPSAVYPYRLEIEGEELAMPGLASRGS